MAVIVDSMASKTLSQNTLWVFLVQKQKT